MTSTRFQPKCRDERLVTCDHYEFANHMVEFAQSMCGKSTEEQKLLLLNFNSFAPLLLFSREMEWEDFALSIHLRDHEIPDVSITLTEVDDGEKTCCMECKYGVVSITLQVAATLTNEEDFAELCEGDKARVESVLAGFDKDDECMEYCEDRNLDMYEEMDDYLLETCPIVRGTLCLPG